ncbi:MAG: hypothetical protein WCS56_03885 [Bacilli bacterium]
MQELKLKKIAKSLIKTISKIALIILAISTVYYFSDLIFSASDAPSNFSNYTLFRPSYTSEPVELEQTVNPDHNWVYRRMSSLFFGFIPGYVVLMALGIVFIAGGGFAIMYVATTKADTFR